MAEATVSDFVGAVDRMILVHNAWSADEQEPGNKPPQSFLDAAESAFDVAHKASIRGSERKLLAAVETFEQAFQAFMNGTAMRRSGEPADGFWTALRDVIHERRVSGEMVLRRPESVATLRRQKVSDFQIAQQIYGRRGRGPFLDDGRIRHDLIDQEEKDPGSVVPADWVPEAEIERLRDHHIAMSDQLDGRTSKRPPTVESMLREGTDTLEICTACGVTEKQVKAIAKVLDIPIQPECASEAAAEK